MIIFVTTKCHTFVFKVHNSWKIVFRSRAFNFWGQKRTFAVFVKFVVDDKRNRGFLFTISWSVWSRILGTLRWWHLSCSLGMSLLDLINLKTKMEHHLQPSCFSNFFSIWAHQPWSVRGWVITLWDHLQYPCVPVRMLKIFKWTISILLSCLYQFTTRDIYISWRETVLRQDT